MRAEESGPAALPGDGSVVRLTTDIDEAFERYRAARDRAIASGERADFDHAGRCFSAAMEAFMAPERRWPRDPSSLRLLSPSELAGNRSRPR